MVIDREGFREMARCVPTVRGEAYCDVDTIFGDFCRLVVGWVARQSPAELEAEYERSGWKGSPAARAMKEVAKYWMGTREEIVPSR